MIDSTITNTTHQPDSGITIEPISRDTNYEDYVVAFGYVYVQTAICAIGLILNLINFSVFSRPNFSAPAYILMTFLSLVDATTLGLRIPQGYIFMPKLIGHSNDAVLFVYVYVIFIETPMTNMTENISAWLTVTLAIERYTTMKNWHLTKQLFTEEKTKRVIYGICISAILFNTPYFALQTISIRRVHKTLELHSSMTPFSQSIYYAIHSWLRIILVQIIPLCFLCISNCLLFSLLSKHNNKFRTAHIRTNKSTNYPLIPVNHTKCSVEICHSKDQKQMTCDEFRQNRITLPALDAYDRSNMETSEQLNNGRAPITNVTSSSEQTDGSLEPPQPKRTQNKKKRAKAIHVTRHSLDRSQRRKAAQKKLTILLLAVILLFLIGQVPQSLAYFRVFTTLGLCAINQVEHCVAHRIYRMISVNLAQLAFASTFFVYLFLNRDFRETIVGWIHCRCFIK